MLRAALVVTFVSFGVSFGAVAQTPADLARLMGPQSAVSHASAPVDRGIVAAGGGTGVDLARLAPVQAGSGVSAAPAWAVSGGAFAAGDLARLTAAGVATWRVAPDMAVAAKE